ncbi:MAG: ABC transporter ATP-binding protein [Clostridiales bacterium]|nr:ABC transporter ATP-binding protein [Clostridiales bacterium]
MFEIRDLIVHYGVIQALKSISLKVDEGEIVTLIGANGAGKTTTLRAISGIIPATSGSIIFQGEDIVKAKAPARVAMGISQAPEGRRIFAEMTVLENLELGAYLRTDKAAVQADIKNVYERFPILGNRRKQLAGTLSGGEQQMLAMGRALMSRPKIMLLDEPSMGLAPMLVSSIFSIIREINKAGTTVLLVEQNARMALAITHRAYVIETGRIVASGTGDELAKSDEIIKAYLGN